MYTFTVFHLLLCIMFFYAMWSIMEFRSAGASPSITCTCDMYMYVEI